MKNKINFLNPLIPISLIPFLISCATVPYTGRRHLILISPREEMAMGGEAYKKTLNASKLSHDKEAVEMVRRVGERLASVAEASGFKWEFNLIEDPKTVNAFCLPGGKVAVYSGLLPVAKEEAGLSVVMGHEIAHALARHGAERMSQGMLANFGGAALSIMLANKPAATRDLYAQAYGMGIGLGVMLPFSRSQEAEADHIGLILMTKAGYDPHETIEFWKRMEKSSKEPNSPFGKYFSTHPDHGERIQNIQGWIPEALSYYKK
ncbi:MAG: M48 family metallopeptidase [Elusimicrobia bacterium]|nr:M48 family metallopeptidase [Elusimicrobiota bacterium]